ncbi:hypothetical protein HMPREF9436_00860 [Faecalibacterium cf. prausnitzii KLE1255]|uniref:Uncharacterized protein n=1 Tax=Faecalibacterium cf. prausnitzii KLE1255 TaxID=748224 RepID=E2ZGS4_9FIRM|nr:hypothetical protein HMPREF9436_00860 [Faecalibacterium cf. prausnitzii KLE1255]
MSTSFCKFHSYHLYIAAGSGFRAARVGFGLKALHCPQTVRQTNRMLQVIQKSLRHVHTLL